MLVYSVATQGDSGVWITSYDVLYGIDGTEFARVKDASNNVVVSRLFTIYISTDVSD